MTRCTFSESRGLIQILVLVIKETDDRYLEPMYLLRIGLLSTGCFISQGEKAAKPVTRVQDFVSTFQWIFLTSYHRVSTFVSLIIILKRPLNVSRCVCGDKTKCFQ